MKKNTLALFLSSALVAPAVAFAADAQPSFYVGGGYSFTNLDSSVTNDDADIGVLSVIGGYQVNENLAAEIRIGAGVSDDTVHDVKYKNDYMYGLYLKMGAPTPIGLYPYFIAGWTEIKAEADPKGGKSIDDKGGDITYGVGVDYWFTSNLAAGLEYAKYYDKDDYKIDGASLNVKYKF